MADESATGERDTEAVPKPVASPTKIVASQQDDELLNQEQELELERAEGLAQAERIHADHAAEEEREKKIAEDRALRTARQEQASWRRRLREAGLHLMDDETEVGRDLREQEEREATIALLNRFAWKRPESSLSDWFWPANEIHTLRVPTDIPEEFQRGDIVEYHSAVIKHMLEEARRRHDYLRDEHPYLLPSRPWRWSGHLGKMYKYLTDEKERAQQIENGDAYMLHRLFTGDDKDGYRPIEPKTRWTQQHGKKDESVIHGHIKPLLDRVCAVATLTTINPVHPSERKSLTEDWGLRLLQEAELILTLLTKYGKPTWHFQVAVEAHSYGGVEADVAEKSKKPAAGDTGGPEINAVDAWENEGAANEVGATTKKPAAAKRRAAIKKAKAQAVAELEEEGAFVDAGDAPDLQKKIKGLQIQLRMAKNSAIQLRSKAAAAPGIPQVDGAWDGLQARSRKTARPGAAAKQFVDDEAELSACDGDASGDEEELADAPTPESLDESERVKFRKLRKEEKDGEVEGLIAEDSESIDEERERAARAAVRDGKPLEASEPDEDEEPSPPPAPLPASPEFIEPEKPSPPKRSIDLVRPTTAPPAATADAVAAKKARAPAAPAPATPEPPPPTKPAPPRRDPAAADAGDGRAGGAKKKGAGGRKKKAAAIVLGKPTMPDPNLLGWCHHWHIMRIDSALICDVDIYEMLQRFDEFLLDNKTSPPRLYHLKNMMGLQRYVLKGQWCPVASICLRGANCAPDDGDEPLGFRIVWEHTLEHKLEGVIPLISKHLDNYFYAMRTVNIGRIGFASLSDRYDAAEKTDPALLPSVAKPIGDGARFDLRVRQHCLEKKLLARNLGDRDWAFYKRVDGLDHSYELCLKSIKQFKGYLRRIDETWVDGLRSQAKGNWKEELDGILPELKRDYRWVEFASDADGLNGGYFYIADDPHHDGTDITTQELIKDHPALKRRAEVLFWCRSQDLDMYKENGGGGDGRVGFTNMPMWWPLPGRYYVPTSIVKQKNGKTDIKYSLRKFENCFLHKGGYWLDHEGRKICVDDFVRTNLVYINRNFDPPKVEVGNSCGYHDTLPGRMKLIDQPHTAKGDAAWPGPEAWLSIVEPYKRQHCAGHQWTDYQQNDPHKPAVYECGLCHIHEKGIHRPTCASHLWDRPRNPEYVSEAERLTVDFRCRNCPSLKLFEYNEDGARTGVRIITRSEFGPPPTAPHKSWGYDVWAHDFMDPLRGAFEVEYWVRKRNVAIFGDSNLGKTSAWLLLTDEGGVFDPMDCFVVGDGTKADVMAGLRPGIRIMVRLHLMSLESRRSSNQANQHNQITFIVSELCCNRMQYRAMHSLLISCRSAKTGTPPNASLMLPSSRYSTRDLEWALAA